VTGLSEEARRVLLASYMPPQPVDFTGEVCAKCGRQARKWMMAAADESPTFFCGLWPYCEES
jgi:hypothetical protein